MKGPHREQRAEQMPLPPERQVWQEAAPEAAAEALRGWGLTAPARLLADAHRPYLPLAADLAAFVAPVLRIVLGPTAVAAERALTPDGVERFLARLGSPSPPQAEAPCQTSEG